MINRVLNETSQDVRIHILEEEIRHLQEENACLRSSVYDASAIMNAAKGLSDMQMGTTSVQQVLEYAVNLFELADAGLVTIFDESSGFDEVIATYNHDPTVFTDIHMRPNEGATGWSYAHGKARIWNGEKEALSCLDDVMSCYREALLREQQKPEGLSSSLLCCPMIARGKVIGAIQLEHYGDDRQFVDHEMQLLSDLIAGPLAIALDNFELSDQMREKNNEIRRLLRKTINIQEEERARVAYDLHDNIAQTLAGLHIAFRNLEVLIKDVPNSEEMISYLHELDESVQQTIVTTQDLTFSLRPTILNDHGLVSGLEWYLKSYISKAELSAHFEVADIDEGTIEDWAITTLFRVAQEALSNVVRHAFADNVYVCLTGTNREIILTIADDGCGFAMDESEHTAHEFYLGLRGMRERMSMVGGSLVIRSQIGEGTKVIAIVPLIEESVIPND